MTTLTEDEAALLNHVSMWGSDGWPIHKRGRNWWWSEWRSLRGSPKPYRTKREAFKAFEAYLDILIDRKAGRA